MIQELVTQVTSISNLCYKKEEHHLDALLLI